MTDGLKRTLGPLYSDFIWENLVLEGAVCVAAAQYRLGMLYLERRDIAHAVDKDLGWLTKKEIIVPYRKKNYYIELLGWGKDTVVERKPQKKTKNDESK